MAKERFLIVAYRNPDDCFGRFSETKNRDAIDAGTADESDAYSWIEATYEIGLVRYREATHCCSFTPSAWFVWLENAFVGEPNAAWDYDGDPDGLEHENGGESGTYISYRDEWPADLICESFTIDTVKDLDLRKPAAPRSLMRRNEKRHEKQAERLDAYHRAIWDAAEAAAREFACNGLYCERLDVFKHRQHERNTRPIRFVGDDKEAAA